MMRIAFDQLMMISIWLEGILRSQAKVDNHDDGFNDRDHDEVGLDGKDDVDDFGDDDDNDDDDNDNDDDDKDHDKEGLGGRSQAMS